MKRIAFFLLLPLLLAAQPVPPGTSGRQRPGSAPQVQPPPTKPEDLCSLEGQALNATTREPMAVLTAQALRCRYTQGRKQLVSFGSASTTDIGAYRIFGLPPGRYYISVSPRRSYAQNRSGAGQQAEEEFVPTYYPGTTD